MEENIIIYKTKQDKIDLKVQLDNDTVWLTQEQMSKLFNKSKSTINEHIKNIFIEGELSELESKRKFGNSEFSTKPTNLYNLDVIISVGYRVKSLEGTQFRIWATNVLRKYLVEGYAINQDRLEKDRKKYEELQSHIKTLRKVIENESFNLDQSKELVRIISDYAEGLELIDKVDHENVELPKLKKKKGKKIKYEDAKQDIESLKLQLEAHSLFGNEKDKGFESALNSIFQTFDGKELYPSVEQKAANLLYLIIKNHPFTDGNKRIGSFMFIRFLDLNGLLYKPDGTKLVAENALVAIALLIAQSDNKQKDLMINLVVNLIV